MKKTTNSASVADFYARAEGDLLLAQKIAQLEINEDTADTLLAIAKDAGFTFTAEDMVNFEQDALDEEVLDDEALESVSGGARRGYRSGRRSPRAVRFEGVAYRAAPSRPSKFRAEMTPAISRAIVARFFFIVMT